jgi:hypothetical protein
LKAAATRRCSAPVTSLHGSSTWEPLTNLQHNSKAHCWHVCCAGMQTAFKKFIAKFDDVLFLALLCVHHGSACHLKWRTAYV